MPTSFKNNLSDQKTYWTFVDFKSAFENVGEFVYLHKKAQYNVAVLMYSQFLKIYLRLLNIYVVIVRGNTSVHFGWNCIYMSVDFTSFVILIYLS
jgi:hypothetical protein